MAKVAQDIGDRIRASVTVDPNSGCWEWSKATYQGYGRMQVGSYADNSRKVKPAHRVSYEHFVGPIADGLHVDHLCSNRCCVNPAHLEAVTPTVNARRRVASDSPLEYCRNGHKRSDRNTYFIKGMKACRTCDGTWARK